MLTKLCPTIAQTDFENNRALILNLDPLVGDTACHLRTAYLLYLYKKTNPLTSEEITFLNDCTKLPTFSVLDDFGFVLKQTGSKGKVVNSKVNVAKKSIEFLLENIPEDFYRKDEEFFKTKNLEFVKHFIPVLPLYLSVKMLIYFLINNEIPIIINLKRIDITTTEEAIQYGLLGASTLLYEYNKETKKFSYLPCESSSSRVGVKFDLYSTVSEIDDGINLPDFFRIRDYDAFLRVFKSLEIDKVILTCAAAHSQFPKSVSQTSLKSFPIPFSSVFKPVKQTIFNLAINPNKCSVGEFNRVVALSKEYGLTAPESIMIQQGGSNEIVRTTRSVPFMIDHTRVSTFNEAFSETNKLIAQNSSIVVPINSNVGFKL